MCGIAGAWGDGAWVRGALATLRHRGPDGEAIHEDGPVTLGHCRLAIVDLSSAGDQPMVDAATGVSLVYNGEVYDHEALRAILERKGHRFQGRCDTEVVLRGYLEWGDGVLDRIDGMFALALWDPRDARLILARDPLGIKPLYVAQNVGDTRWAFASEAKALWPLVAPLRPNPRGLSDLLRFHYVQAPRTLVAGVEQLRPGEVVTIRASDVQRRTLTLHERGGPPPRSPTELAGMVRGTVSAQMRADVPVGTFLSGGLDSTLITALAAAEHPGIHSYTVGFDEGPEDGRSGRDAAAALDTTHHFVSVRGEGVARALADISWHMDGPVAEAGAIPNWFLAKAAAAHVRVVLAGEGADEVFGGYAWYRKYRRRSAWPRPGSSWMAGRLPRRLGVRRAQQWLAGNAVERYEAYVDRYAPRDVRASGLPATNLAAPRTRDPRVIDRATLLRGALLPKADRMTMAHSIEQRVPFLGLELAATCSRIRGKAAYGPPDKALLRAAAQTVLPSDVKPGPKQGFGTPTDAWLAGRLAPWADKQDARAVQHDWLSAGAWKHLQIQARPGATAWILPSLEMWLDVIDRRGLLS